MAETESAVFSNHLRLADLLFHFSVVESGNVAETPFSGTASGRATRARNVDEVGFAFSRQDTLDVCLVEEKQDARASQVEVSACRMAKAPEPSSAEPDYDPVVAGRESAQYSFSLFRLHSLYHPCSLSHLSPALF